MFPLLDDQNEHVQANKEMYRRGVARTSAMSDFQRKVAISDWCGWYSMCVHHNKGPEILKVLAILYLLVV